MNFRFLLSFVLLLAFASTLIVFAQEAELSLYTKITNSIEKNEPEWKLDRKAIMSNQVIIRWTSGKGRSFVSVSLLSSEIEATEAFKSRLNLLMNIPETKTSKSELKGFGDACYLLKNEGAVGANIIFRKGSYTVEVFAPSVEIAKRFAQHVSDLLPTSNKSPKLTAQWHGFHHRTLSLC